MLYLSQYIPSFPLPFLPTITLDKIISIAFFAILAIFIIRGAYLAQKGISSSETSSRRFRDAFARENISLSNSTEADKMVYLSSYLPLIGIITASRHPNPITRTGEKIGSIWLLITLLIYNLDIGSELAWIILFVYLAYIAFVGVSLFVYEIVPGFAFTEMIPDLSTIYLHVRAIFPYLGKLLLVIFGKSSELQYVQILDQIREKDVQNIELAKTYFTDPKLPLPRSFIFIPVINFLFLPQIFLKKNSIYILAILQGIVISLCLMGLWYFIDFTTPWQTFFLFAIFLGIANLGVNPFYKIPLIYDIYSIFDLVTFGIGGKVGKLKEKHKESASVSYKI
jgi:hypothetical protein